MNGCSVPRRFFVRTGECIQHHPITKEKRNQIKMETKQKRNKKWLQPPSRGEHDPVLLAFQTIGEIRFQNGTFNSHANCQAVEA